MLEFMNASLTVRARPEAFRRLLFSLLQCLVLALLLAACGNKGALYLPDEPMPEQANPPATADPSDADDSDADEGDS